MLVAILGITPTTTRVVGRGKRLIILHTMGEEGWVDGALFTNVTAGEKADYHQEMNADTFENYLRKLCPKLGEGAVLIMDNAPYHSRKLRHAPTMSWRYDDMTVWCDENHIDYHHERATTDRSVKDRFLKIDFFRHFIQPNIRPEHNQYAAEDIASRYGVEILRLPPYHCFFNPIEMAWSVIKHYVAKDNSIEKVAHKLDVINGLLESVLENIARETFVNWVRHTADLEEKYRQAQVVNPYRQQPPTVRRDDDSDDDDDDESDGDILRDEDDDELDFFD